MMQFNLNKPDLTMQYENINMYNSINFEFN